MFLAERFELRVYVRDSRIHTQDSAHGDCRMPEDHLPFLLLDQLPVKLLFLFQEMNMFLRTGMTQQKSLLSVLISLLFESLLLILSVFLILFALLLIKSPIFDPSICCSC